MPRNLRQPPEAKISAATVRADFNDLPAVVYYTRAAHELGLWASERALIDRFFPDPAVHLLEAGCGAGRVTLGLWQLGYRRLTAFDFAEELLDQARSLALERRAAAIAFVHADATDLRSYHLLGDKHCTSAPRAGNSCNPIGDAAPTPPPAAGQSCNPIGDTNAELSTEASASCNPIGDAAPGRAPPVLKSCNPIGDTAGATAAAALGNASGHFGGALFMFNGLMQIPGRSNRRAALGELHRVCAPGAPLLFTTHDRDSTPTERALWRLEAMRWERGAQDPRLVEFGDRYFSDAAGRTFMHLPDRREVLEDLAAAGWRHAFDAMRMEIAREHHAVRDFSDECRFWAAHRGP